jgi:hypothetical protein
VPLAKLEETGLLVVDRDVNEVREGRRFEAKWKEVFEQVHRHM